MQKIHAMYRGFNLSLDNNCYFKKFQKIGLESFSSQKASIEEKINSFVGDDGSLDGSMMQANWFPQIKADIFISHSHKDENLAIALAGWLKETFGLTAFIDSCVWGYANDLLKMIDDKYCLKDIHSYSYEKRNYSTSHVHMMLSVALTQMIDNTECLFFLNTPNSITPDTIINQTESPWIYSEIAATRLIRKRSRKEYRLKPMVESFSEGGRITPRIKYGLPVDHLTDIDNVVLRDWVISWQDVGYRNHFLPQYSEDLGVHALDKLYELTKEQNG